MQFYLDFAPSIRKKHQVTSKRRKLQEDTSFLVLRLLQESPEMSQRELAQAVGVSVGSVHYVLSALIEKGLVKLNNFTAMADKRRYAYVLTPNGIARRAELTRSFLARKIEEYEALKNEIELLSSELEAQKLASSSLNYEDGFA
tara:strand:- start:226 stop:657 length:432 start_codon:yes stop_codon:yes gene_type:complete